MGQQCCQDAVASEFLRTETSFDTEETESDSEYVAPVGKIVNSFSVLGQLKEGPCTPDRKATCWSLNSSTTPPKSVAKVAAPTQTIPMSATSSPASTDATKALPIPCSAVSYSRLRRQQRRSSSTPSQHHRIATGKHESETPRRGTRHWKCRLASGLVVAEGVQSAQSDVSLEQMSERVLVAQTAPADVWCKVVQQTDSHDDEQEFMAVLSRMPPPPSPRMGNEDFFDEGVWRLRPRASSLPPRLGSRRS